MNTDTWQCVQCGEPKEKTRENFLMQSKNGGLRLDKPCRQCNKENALRRERSYTRKHAAERAKKAREWCKAHPNKRAVQNANYRAKTLGLPAELNLEDWEQCLEYFGNKCVICGATPNALISIALDHWVPLKKKAAKDNPGSVAWNIIPLCHAPRGGSNMRCCNITKGSSDPVEWLEDVFGRQRADQALKRINGWIETVKSGVAYGISE